jgi:hypothetical protein
MLLIRVPFTLSVESPVWNVEWLRAVPDDTSAQIPESLTESVFFTDLPTEVLLGRPAGKIQNPNPDYSAGGASALVFLGAKIQSRLQHPSKFSLVHRIRLGKPLLRVRIDAAFCLREV